MICWLYIIYLLSQEAHQVQVVVGSCQVKGTVTVFISLRFDLIWMTPYELLQTPTGIYSTKHTVKLFTFIAPNHLPIQLLCMQRSLHTFA